MKEKIKEITSINNILILFFIAFFSILLRDYSFGYANHSFYIPFIDKILDPSLFQNDLIFSFNYNNTFFYYIIAFFNKFWSLEIIFIVGYIIFSVSYVFAVYKLSYLLFKNIYISYLAVFFLVFPKQSIGGGDATFYGQFYYNIISITFLLYSIYFFLIKKYVISYLVLGTVFLFHAISAVHVFGLYLIYFFIDILLKYKLNFFTFLKSEYCKKIIFSFILFFIIISPLLFFKFSFENESTSFLNIDLNWLKIQEIRSSHHIFPSHWFLNFLKALPYIVLALISILFFHQNKSNLVSQSNFEVHRDVNIFFIGFLVLMQLGTIFTEIFPLKLFVLFQFFRSTNFLMIIFLMYSAFFVYKVSKNSAEKKY
jgi:hypothetical protein